MELGATICLPRNPQCLLCPVADTCEARASGTQDICLSEEGQGSSEWNESYWSFVGTAKCFLAPCRE